MPSSTKRKPVPYQLRIQFHDKGASTSTTHTPVVKKKSKSQNWRMKMKEKDTEKYRDIQQKAKDYSTWYRLQCATAKKTLGKRNINPTERAVAEKWAERLQRNNEASRRRMNEMNKRKRAERISSNKKPKKVMTRKQLAATRKKEAEKKRQQRSKLTSERREAIKARRRELYRQKTASFRQRLLEEELKKMKEREDRLKAMEEELTNKEAEFEEHVAEVNKRLPEDEAVDVRSVKSRNKALERIRKALPKKRQASINTIIDLVSKASPRKQKAFCKAGMSKDPVSESVAEAVGIGLAGQKKSVQRKAVASVLSSIKKKNLQRAAARRFGVSRKLLDRAIKRPCGRKQTSAATKQCVRNFYETNSVPLPDRKLVSKKTLKARRVMDMTVAKLYKKYTRTHPNHPVSHGIFYGLRPKEVKTTQQATYVGCLCEYCENMRLKMKAVNNLKGGTFTDLYDVINGTLCPKTTTSKFNKPSCIRRKCNACGVSKLDTKLAPITTENNKEQVKWPRWEMVTTECHTKKGTKIVKKRKPVEKEGNVSDLIKELKDECHPFAQHMLDKDWQNKQEKELIESLHADEVLGIYDFAENYKCEMQREVQSAYYSHDSATLHPVVMYYSCPTCLKSVRESIILVSDDLVHDYNLVHAFQKKVHDHLKTARELKITTFFRFSDGCAAQYKSKGPIADISYARDDFGYRIMHNFSGTRHGKGASDGESGVVKRIASEAVKAGATVISTPQQFYTFLDQNVTKEAEDNQCCIPFRRSVHFVSHKDVIRNRKGRTIKTVPGTRKIHCIKTIHGGKVATRNLSCFCEACATGSGKCKNAVYVNPWKKVELRCSKNGEPKTTKKSDKITPDRDQNSNNHDFDDQAVSPTSGMEVAADDDNLDEDPQPHAVTPSTANHGTEDIIGSSNDTASNEMDTSDDSGVDNHEVPKSTAQPADDTNPADCPQSPTAITKLKVNDYVAVHFDAPTSKCSKGMVYMAMVTTVRNSQMQLKFMRRNNKGLYDFTTEPEALHPETDIVCKLSEPTITRKGRAYLYQFTEKEVELLSTKFILK